MELGAPCKIAFSIDFFNYSIDAIPEPELVLSYQSIRKSNSTKQRKIRDTQTMGCAWLAPAQLSELGSKLIF